MRKTQTTAINQAAVKPGKAVKSDKATSPRRRSPADQAAATPPNPTLAHSQPHSAKPAVRSPLPSSASAAPASAARLMTKQATIEALVSRPGGAGIAELMVVTGWQSHSVRAALTGLRKRGATLVRDVDAAGGSAYRIIQEEP